MYKGGLLIVATAIAYSAIGSTHAADINAIYLEQNIPIFRNFIGRPLLEAVIGLNNGQNLVLETLTPQGATFFWTGDKIPGETFDSLKARTLLSVSITTCNGAKDLEATISGVSIWQALIERGDGGINQQAYVATHLQRLLELMNSPPSITTPNALRPPRAASVKGIVFEYVKGDTTEQLSLLNDPGEKIPEFTLRANWQIVSSAHCPK